MTQPGRLWRSLYVQVLIAIAPGALVCWLLPAVDLGLHKAAFAGRGGDFEEAESDALQIEGRSDIG